MARSEAAPSLTLIQADEARRILADTPPVGRERVALGAALGRVLAEAVRGAGRDLPGERRSVMDGYAVRGADVARRIRRCGRSFCAWRARCRWATCSRARSAPGEAVAIATGGCASRRGRRRRHGRARRVPGRRRARRAVARGRRRAPTSSSAARISRAAPPCCPRGGACARRISAMLATFGVTTVDVHRRPRVAVLSTGNELCDPAETPRPGQVRDANQTALGAQVTAAGCDVTSPASSPTTRRRCGGRSRARSTGTTRSSSRAGRRSGPRTCRPTRSPISNRPASCSTASTSGPGSRRCSRARAASPSWACPASRRRR